MDRKGDHFTGKQGRFSYLGAAAAVLAAGVMIGVATVAVRATTAPGLKPRVPNDGGDPGGGGPGPGDGLFAPLVAGGARPWEGGFDVSTYSSVNPVNGNLLTVIPIAS